MSVSINGTNGLTFADNSTQNTAASGFGFKNRIINGAMQVWQRGTSASNSGTGGSSAAYSTADRWQVFRDGSVAGADVSRQTTGAPSGSQYYMRAQRTAGNTSTNSINISQSIETVNMLDLAGNSVTLSFQLRVGSNFSGVIRAYIIYGTGTDGNLFNGFTGQTPVVGPLFTPNTGWQTFQVTGTIPSNASQLGISIYWTPSGTAGANDYIDIDLVQLEKGSTTTSFDYRPYSTELALCQRYFVAMSGEGSIAGYWGSFYATNACRVWAPLPVVMRVAPTLTFNGTTFERVGAGTTTGTIANVISATRSISFDGATLSPLASAIGVPAAYYGNVSCNSEV